MALAQNEKYLIFFEDSRWLFISNLA